MLRKADFDKKIKNEKLKMIIALYIASEMFLVHKRLSRYAPNKKVKICVWEENILDFYTKEPIGEKRFFYKDFAIGNNIYKYDYIIRGKKKNQAIKI